MNPKPFDVTKCGLIRIEEEKLLVNAQAMADHWGLYMNTKLEPEMYMLNAAINALAVDGKVVQLRNNHYRTRYRIIDMDNIYSWMSGNLMGDRDAIEARLKGIEYITDAYQDSDDSNNDDPLDEFISDNAIDDEANNE